MLFNQDTDNDIITLRQPGLSQRIIYTLHLDNNTSLSTPTYFYLQPTNNKTSQDSQNCVSTVGMLGYIQDCPFTNIIHVTVIISIVPQVFRYIPYSKSSYEEVSKQTSLYFKRVKLNITIDKMKSDILNNSASTSRHDIKDNSDYVKICTRIVFGIIGFP